VARTKPKSVRLPPQLNDQVTQRLRELGEMEFSEYVKELIRKDILRGGDFTVVVEPPPPPLRRGRP